MKKFILFLSLFSIFGNCSLFSQDVIFKIDRTEMNVKVVEIQEYVIKYRAPETPDVIREIRISDVFMIIYENGAREVFSSAESEQVQKQVTQPVQQQAQVAQTQKTQAKQIPLGYVTQGHLGISIPYDEDVSEFYKIFPSFGISFEYWKKWWGARGVLDFAYTKGNPYLEGDIDESDLRMGIFSITASGYYAANSTRKNFFYVGGGAGYAYVLESLSLSAYGQSVSESFHWNSLKLSVEFGMKIRFFFWEIGVSDIIPFDNEMDVNFGGIYAKVGFFL